MEELYQSIIPGASIIHSIDWSCLNLIAVSISVNKKGYVGEGLGSSKTHQLLVFEANRPWQYHCVYGDSKAITREVKWSLNGHRLLSIEQDNIARVWRMKEDCINTWTRSHRVELNNKLLHAGWVDYKPLPNVNCTKKAWPELLEYHCYSSILHALVPEAAIFVYSNGKVQLVSFNDSEPVQNELQLEVDGNLCAAGTLVSSDGTLLCVVVCSDGLVKLFVLSVQANLESRFNLKASLATSFHPTGGGGGQLTDLVMHPDTGGCLLHICYDNTNMLQWSLRDTEGSYLAKRESLEIMPQPVTCIDCTTLCLKGCGPSPASLATTPAAGSEFILDVPGENRDKRWPVELMVMVHQDNTTTILNRSSYQKLYHGKLDGEPSNEPASKRSRVELERGSTCLSLCLSPNGCCVAFTCAGTISVYSLCPFVLGEKGFSPPDISRWSVLLAMAAVRHHSVWDIAVMCSRVAFKQEDPGQVMKVLEQWSEDFMNNSDSWLELLLPVYHYICYTLHCCHDKGLPLSLDQRDILRLHATFSLLLLSLPSTCDQEVSPAQSLKDTSESPEDNIDNITRSLQQKDFVITKDVAGQLHGHAHWILELAIKIASRIAALTIERIPDMLSLKILRQSLMLIYVWNKCLPSPVLAVNDAAISLLFKVITHSVNSPLAGLDESLKSDVSKNIPYDDSSLTLTLTKAANLQGFLHGLSKTGELPEIFYRDHCPRLRPHIQHHYPTTDPYSPLGLVIPRGLAPPWKDVFVEGQLDVIHGGLLSKAVVQDAKLRQCSSCRCWTVASNDISDDTSSDISSHPVQQWRHCWSHHCVCGSSWLTQQFKHYS